MTRSSHPKHADLDVKNAQQIPWKRIAVEAIAIVASILLAFSIDRWWELRKERLEERQAVAQLTADFTANAAQLETIRSVHESAVEAAYELLARARAGEPQQSDATTAELVFRSIRSWTYDPVLGGIHSLIQSGNLGLLRNDSLRVAVAAWPDIVDDLSDDEWLETRTLFEQTAPYLISKGKMTDVLLAGGKLNRLSDLPALDQSELLSDPIFLQWLTWRINSLENVLLEVQEVEDAIHEILELLESSQVAD